ncbi:MAG: hypothetical protein GWP09_02850 [Nitrospiraceae bacterium]|nr:hypothetical protein [Nitrospiraceae bacterium]
MKPQPLDLNGVFDDMCQTLKKFGFVAPENFTDEIKTKIIQHIKSAYEFYDEYVDLPILLLKEHKEYGKRRICLLTNLTEKKEVTFEEFVDYIKAVGFDEVSKQIDNCYNDWLLKLTFENCIGDD